MGLHPEVLASNATFYESGVAPVSSTGGEPVWWGNLRDALETAGVVRQSVMDPIYPSRLGSAVGVALFAGVYPRREYQSLFMHVTSGGARFLFTGDSYCDYENQLVEKYGGKDIFAAHALKVTHHGSQDGTSRRLSAAANPGIAFASTCDDAGHRWEDASRSRLSSKCKKFETWRHGDVIVGTDGGPIKDGILFEVETLLPGRLADRLMLPADRDPYQGTQPTSSSQRGACNGT